MSKRRGRLLFVDKKKQKNFYNLGRAGDTATSPVEQKFFAPLFFKKAASCLFPLKPIRLWHDFTCCHRNETAKGTGTGPGCLSRVARNAATHRLPTRIRMPLIKEPVAWRT